MPRVEADTALYGVAGWPLQATLSPRLHNAAFTALGIPAVYLPLRVAPRHAGHFVQALDALGVLGANVTAPHKEAAFGQCVKVSPAAAAARSVNTLTRTARGWTGETTDGEGLLDCLRGQDVAVEKTTVALFGSGGASRSVLVALLRRRGNRVRLVTRRPASALELLSGVTHLGPGSSLEILARGGEASRRAVRASRLVLNGTTLGAAGGTAMPCPPEWVSAGSVAVDFVYGRETPWRRALRRRGVVALSGLGMLIHQAARSFRLWTGKDALSWMLWTGGWDEERIRAGLAAESLRDVRPPRG